MLIGLYGSGGFGREVMPILDRQAPGRELVFIDDLNPAATVNGFRVMRYAEFLAHPAHEKFFNVAIASSTERRRLAEKCIADGIRPLQVRAGESVCYEPNSVAEGAIFCAHTTLTANATIGRYFHANIYSYVAHDCVIGDFVTFAPAVRCNGWVIVEDDAYVGTGAVIRNGSAEAPIIIGKGAVVGMGAVVTKSVPAGTTVVGNPARPLLVRGS